MSGHSKWSTIKRAKQANDAARGKLFSKLSRGISIAVKTGGGPSIDTNYKLRVAVDAARAANMPKATIDRAIQKASESGKLEEITYEGFGPNGVQVLIEAATDNKNRTAQEIKSLLDRAGGSLGGPGSVSFNFEAKGRLVVKTSGDKDEQMLSLIDLGVEDIEETEGGLECFVPFQKLYETKEALEDAGFEVLESELVQKPVSTIDADDKSEQKIIELLENLEDHEDIQSVFTNALV